jgi:hypothetical protein
MFGVVGVPAFVGEHGVGSASLIATVVARRSATAIRTPTAHSALVDMALKVLALWLSGFGIGCSGRGHSRRSPSSTRWNNIASG